jgi:hypothetical protein
LTFTFGVLKNPRIINFLENPSGVAHRSNSFVR